MIVIMRESHVDADHFGRGWQGGDVILTAQGHRASTIEKYLEYRLTQIRNNPLAFLKQAEEECIAGLACLTQPGAEHSKETGRRAGGGKLTKGS
jgi:hypothetical protein